MLESYDGGAHPKFKRTPINQTLSERIAMTNIPNPDDAAAGALLVRDLFADQFDKLLMLQISDDAIIAGMHMALMAEMERAGGTVRAIATMRAFADDREREAGLSN